MAAPSEPFQPTAWLERVRSQFSSSVALMFTASAKSRRIMSLSKVPMPPQMGTRATPAIRSKGGLKLLPLLGRALHGADEQSPHLRPALPGVGLHLGDDALDIRGEQVILEVDVHHHGDLVGGRMVRKN